MNQTLTRYLKSHLFANSPTGSMIMLIELLKENKKAVIELKVMKIETLGRYCAGTWGVIYSKNRSKFDISDVAREEIEQSEEEPGLFSDEVLESEDLCCSCFSLCLRSGGGL